HVGGPEFLGPENATEILRRAREAGVVTCADILADGWPELLDMLAPAMEWMDYLFPNEEQALALTGVSGESVDAARALLDRGVRCVAMTRGADGSSIVTSDGVEDVPAFEVDVVDTTGCGDAFAAGFIRGLSLGRAPREAAVVCSATGPSSTGSATPSTGSGGKRSAAPSAICVSDMATARESSISRMRSCHSASVSIASCLTRASAEAIVRSASSRASRTSRSAS